MTGEVWLDVPWAGEGVYFKVQITNQETKDVRVIVAPAGVSVLLKDFKQDDKINISEVFPDA